MGKPYPRCPPEFVVVNLSAKLEKVGQTAGIIVASLGGLGIGYHLGAQRDSLTSYLAAGAEPPLDYYCSEPSFSEVENAKANLDGLCQRFRTEIQARRVRDHQWASTVASLQHVSEPHIKDAITDLERGMGEFAGTSQQLDVVLDLLQALKKMKEFNRWVQVYLTALYEQPTHPVVVRLAGEAVEVSKLCGHEREVLAGLAHLEEIPVEFAGKQQIQTVLRDHKASFTANDAWASVPSPSK